MEACNYKGHAVCVPCPAQSHVKAMLKLAKLLHHRGFHITFVSTEFNYQSVRYFKSLDGLPNFRFETIHTPADDKYIRNDFMLEKLLKLIHKLNHSSSNVNLTAVSCLISDGFMPFTVAAAEQLGLPIVMFITISACSFMGFNQFRILREKGLTPVEDESSLTKQYLDTVIDWIPGMKDIRIRDLPSFVRITDPNDFMYNYVMDAVESATKASGIIIHTFDALEGQVLDALSAMFPHVFTIGPLQLLLNYQIGGEDGMINSIRYNPWKEETECLQWLDSNEPKSVIYVNFGSIAVLTKQQLIEVGMGLINSNHTFLWIVRADLLTGDAAELPCEFEAKAKGKGFIASWCPQEDVLNHPSIGGFFTHSGWNSTIESLSAGLPMICWPFEGDQMTNCKYTCNEWGVGLETSGEQVNRNEVEKLVRELMEGDKGKRMRNKATEWKKLAEEAAAPHGSSSRNLEKLVNEMKFFYQKSRCRPEVH